MIAGFGPVGAACAIALAQRLGGKAQLSILDGRPLTSDTADPRMIAISAGSRVLLERLGAWDPANATPIETIHVSQRGHFGRTLIRARDYRLPALGYVMPYGSLAGMLQQRVRALGIDIRPGRIASVQPEAEHCQITLVNHDTVRADYLVHAEGGTFGDQAPRQISRTYHQEGLTAIVGVSHPIAGCAYERFTPAGPIALLPCRHLGIESYALVWCAAPADCQQRLMLSEAAFLEQLAIAFGRRVGDFLSVSARASFPLGLNIARTWPSPREPVIGNAAQTLHPVAGQGFNLGLRDAILLGESMSKWFAEPQQLQRRFLGVRRLDRGTTVGFTDFMPRVFGLPVAPVVAAGALTLLDLLPGLRGPLAKQMMYGRR